MIELRGFSQPNPPTPEQEHEHLARVYSVVLDMIRAHACDIEHREAATSQPAIVGGNPA